MIISKTPFRVSFLGGGTDYPIWFKDHTGAVLGTTIDKYGYFLTRYLPPYFDFKTKISYSKVEYVNKFKEIDHPLIRECLKLVGIKKGIEIYYFADLQAHKGMGSSSLFTVGLLNALYKLSGQETTSKKLASDAINIEQYILNRNVGWQDQIHSAYGGFNLIEFYKDDYKVIPIDGFPQLEQYLLLFDTGLKREASVIACLQIEQTPRKIKELEQMQQMVYEGLELLLAHRFLDFGLLLGESWKLKKSLTTKISTPVIDTIYNTAIKAGAIGGKLLGAGGGGYMLFFAQPDKQKKNQKCFTSFEVYSI